MVRLVLMLLVPHLLVSSAVAQTLTQSMNESSKALAEAHELQGELIQSEKLAGIGTLAAGIAHEVSSPLFGVMGLAEAILEEQDPQLVREYATDIVEYCRGIRDIVVELSSFIRRPEEFQTAVDMTQVTEDALRLVQRSAPVDGVDFHVEIHGEPKVYARVNEVQQVFVNLIKNASEAVREAHGSSGGHIEIQVGAEPDHVWAEVADNGVGIPNDKLSVVFDPFYTTKPPGKGTGLGLNVVWRIVTKYRGTVTVDSQVGRGTRIRFKLPTQG